MTTVLFVHGLESDPRGKKAVALEQAGFTVVSGQMPCNRRAILLDPVVIASLVTVLGVFVAASLHGVLGSMMTLGAFAALRPLAQSRLTRRMFRRSVAVQLALLRSHHIDAVVGSSFGGAVSLELLTSGSWKGPTLLLCPAHRLVAGRAWRPTPVLPSGASRVVVVHGRQDETVPIEHSRSLVRGTATQLIEVDDGHRLATTANPENFRVWLGLVTTP